MPVDVEGNPLKPGDTVLVRFKAEVVGNDLRGGGGNASLRPIDKDGEPAGPCVEYPARICKKVDQ